MVNTGICPKCKSGEIIDSDKRMRDKVIYHRYVCLSCGYTELYASAKHIDELKKWREKGFYN